MRKQLYNDIKERLKAVKYSNGAQVFNHFDLWNQNVQFIEEETPFQFPAVFIEFEPINWETIGNSTQMAALTFKLHVVTQWNGNTADYSPVSNEALDYLNLPAMVAQLLHGWQTTEHGTIIRQQSIINHNHGNIVDSIEVFACEIKENLLVGTVTIAAPEPDIVPE